MKRLKVEVALTGSAIPLSTSVSTLRSTCIHDKGSRALDGPAVPASVSQPSLFKGSSLLPTASDLRTATTTRIYIVRCSCCSLSFFSPGTLGTGGVAGDSRRELLLERAFTPSVVLVFLTSISPFVCRSARPGRRSSRSGTRSSTTAPPRTSRGSRRSPPPPVRLVAPSGGLSYRASSDGKRYGSVVRQRCG